MRKKNYKESVICYCELLSNVRRKDNELSEFENIIAYNIRILAICIFKRDCSNEDTEILLQELKEWFKVQ